MDLWRYINAFIIIINVPPHTHTPADWAEWQSDDVDTVCLLWQRRRRQWQWQQWSLCLPLSSSLACGLYSPTTSAVSTTRPLRWVDHCLSLCGLVSVSRDTGSLSVAWCLSLETLVVSLWLVSVSRDTGILWLLSYVNLCYSLAPLSRTLPVYLFI